MFKIKIHTNVFIICLFVLSCGNKYNLKNDLVALYSAPINITQDLNIKYNGVDTTINDFLESKLKFIIYTDSMECSSCMFSKMFMWEPFLKYARTYDGKLKYYFIFHPKNENILNDLRNAMRLNPINYPILIDQNGDFEKLNPHLPKNKAFHTFLLDENNKVILVGNPLYNKEIEKLFYKITQERLAK